LGSERNPLFQKEVVWMEIRKQKKEEKKEEERGREKKREGQQPDLKNGVGRKGKKWTVLPGQGGKNVRSMQTRTVKGEGKSLKEGTCWNRRQREVRIL